MATFHRVRTAAGSATLLFLIFVGTPERVLGADGRPDQCMTPQDENFMHSYVRLNASAIGTSRRIVRDGPPGPPAVLGIQSTKGSSAPWATSCPVYLYQPVIKRSQQGADSGSTCQPQIVFDRSSKLVINRLFFRGLRFEVTDTKWGLLSGRLKKKLYHTNTREIAWLISDSVSGTALPSGKKVDVYIYLQDTSKLDDPLSKGHKAYRIEVFDQDDSACDKHRPESAVCNDNDTRFGCRADVGLTPPCEICPRQTDTGGGHEPPIKGR